MRYCPLRLVHMGFLVKSAAKKRSVQTEFDASRHARSYD
jgi:hypothetical protein